MAQHMWGDEDFDWKALSGAEDEIYFWGKKIGRIGGQLKEKFGEIRWYVHIGGVRKISDLIFPGYHYYQWGAERTPFKNILDQISIMYLRPFKPLILRYQRFMYAFAYRQAIKKYSHVADEIVTCADHEDLLFKREREIRDRLWKNEANETQDEN